MIRPFVMGALVLMAVLGAVIGMQNGSGAASDPAIQGDADCNSSVDLRDALRILDFTAAPAQGSGCVPSDGNVNCDGAIDATDALIVLSYSANLPAATAEGCSQIGQPQETPAPTSTTETTTPSATATESRTATASATSPPPSGDMGIEGLAQEGPMCPVERPDSPCPERPVAGAPIQITASDGLQTIIYADDQGRFNAEEATGNYEIEPLAVDGGPFPRPGPSQEVIVTAGEFTEVTVEYDSGIR